MSPTIDSKGSGELAGAFFAAYLDLTKIRCYNVITREGIEMTTCDSSVRVRIDSETKRKASEALSKMGLSISDAVRMTLIQIGANGKLPFSVEIPNARTVQAMAEVDSGEGVKFNSLDELYEDLEI